MLLALNNRHTIPASRLARLLDLERLLRCSSTGSITVSDYGDYLHEHGSASPPSTRTLYEDLNDYVRLCDDLIYGGGKKRVTINDNANEDALTHFFGVGACAWGFAPRLFSSTMRCILLARILNEPIVYEYEPFFENDEIPFDNGLRVGVPIKLFRANDTVYCVVVDTQLNARLTLNLSRVEPNVRFLSPVACRASVDSEHVVDGISNASRAMSRSSVALYSDSGSHERRHLVLVESRDARILRFAIKQFPQLKKTGRLTAELEVDEDTLQLAIDTLASFFERLKRRSASVESYRGNACSITTRPTATQVSPCAFTHCNS